MIKQMVLAGLTLGAFLLIGCGLAAQEKQQAPEPKPGIERLARIPPDLTADQQARLEVMRKAHQEQSLALRDGMTKLQDEFRSLRDDPKADPKRVDSLIDQMAKLRADQMKAGIQHRRDFENILTPAQREKMAKFRDRMREFRGMGRGFGSMHRNRGFGRGFGRGLFQGFTRGFERGFGHYFRGPSHFRPWRHDQMYRHGHGRWRL